MEQWKEVPGTNGKVRVSDTGRIISSMRNDGYELKAQPDRKGYLRVRITIDRERRSLKVHREVARAFVPNPDNKPQVNHIDGNKRNNHAANLEWCTNKENCHHAIESGLWESFVRGSIRENESRKRPIIGTKDGMDTYFESVSEAERAIGSRHVSDVLKGHRSHVKGYSFQYREEVMPHDHAEY